jgi:hypothetical protein
MLARAGLLYSGGRDHSLPETAAKRGNRVIDLERPEGRAVAGTLGAIDLEELAHFRSRGQRYAILDQLERILDEAGHPWELRVVEQLGRPLRSIDLEKLGVGRRSDVRRVILLDDEDAAWTRWAPRHSREPAQARFGLLEDLLARLELSPQASGEIMTAVAAEALLEHARGGVG